MLPKRSRNIPSPTIATLHRTVRPLGGVFVSVRSVPAEGGRFRAAIIVPRAIAPNASERNCFRRRVSAVVADIVSSMSTEPATITITLRRSVTPHDVPRVRDEVLSAFKKSGIVHV